MAGTSDKIRRIAILIANVDAAVARQLLLHLPTEVAKQVRQKIANLGPVDPAERQEIVSEFQATAERQSNAASKPLEQKVGPRTQPNPNNYSSTSVLPTNEGHIPGAPLSHSESSRQSQSWRGLDSANLARLLQDERVSVIAVVLSQLEPQMGVEVLKRLPKENHREVLRRLSSLQEINDQAMEAIHDHLAARLTAFQKVAAPGSARVSALLAAAPDDWQTQWSQLLMEDDESNRVNSAANHFTETFTQVTEHREVHRAKASANYSNPLDNLVVTVDMTNSGNSTKPTASTPSRVTAADQTQDFPTILPISTAMQAANSKPSSELSDNDRSLIQLEFERILQLDPHQLAILLSNTPSHTVLLALAGATSTFMQQFYRMLDKFDAKLLAEKIARIGPLRLRDVDEAQRQIAERADQLFRTPARKKQKAA